MWDYYQHIPHEVYSGKSIWWQINIKSHSVIHFGNSQDLWPLEIPVHIRQQNITCIFRVCGFVLLYHKSYIYVLSHEINILSHTLRSNESVKSAVIFFIQLKVTICKQQKGDIWGLGDGACVLCSHTNHTELTYWGINKEECLVVSQRYKYTYFIRALASAIHSVNNSMYTIYIWQWWRPTYCSPVISASLLRVVSNNAYIDLQPHAYMCAKNMLPFNQPHMYIQQIYSWPSLLTSCDIQVSRLQRTK